MLQFLLIAHPYMSPYLSTITTTLSVLFFLTVSYTNTGIWASSAARPSINVTHSGIIHGLQCSSRVSEGMEIFQTSTTSTNTSLHTSRPYDHWHASHTPHIPPDESPWRAYPVRLCPYFGCVILITMWFYNMFLRCCQCSWDDWVLLTNKSLIPRLKFVQSVLNFMSWLRRINPIKLYVPNDKSNKFETCDPAYCHPYDSGVIPPSLNHLTALKCSTSPTKRRPLSARRRRNAPVIGGKALYAIMFALFGRTASPFHLRSQRPNLELRQYRSYNGKLLTYQIPSLKLSQLRQQLQQTSDAIPHYTRETLGVDVSNMANGIVDTGCSITVFNSYKFMRKESITKLAKPLVLGGIAGGLAIEYVGIADLETILPNGKVHSFSVIAAVHKKLPQVLISPQAFLSQQRTGLDTLLSNGGMLTIPKDPDILIDQDSKLEQHFSFFHNRAEWHKDGQRLLTISPGRHSQGTNIFFFLFLFHDAVEVTTLLLFRPLQHATGR